MHLGLLPADSTWGELTDEAGELAQEHGLGELQHSFPARAGISVQKINRTYLFGPGLVRQDFDKQPEVFRWADITAWTEPVAHHYQNGNYLHTNFAYTFTRSDGLSTKLEGDYRDALRVHRPESAHSLPQGTLLAQTCRELVKQLVDAALPAELDALERGEALEFGDFSLTRQGFCRKGQLVPWTTVESAEVKDGWFRVKEAGRRRPRYQIAASRIPRFSLMIALIDTLDR